MVRDREDEADERAVAFGEPQVLGPHPFHNLQVECEERRLGNCGIKEIISKARECEGMNALQVILDAGRVEGPQRDPLVAQAEFDRLQARGLVIKAFGDRRTVGRAWCEARRGQVFDPFPRVLWLEKEGRPAAAVDDESIVSPRAAVDRRDAA